MKSKFTFRNYTQEYYPIKQRNAAMPNLIHSLDASSIALLYDVYCKEVANNIYTVHDCFAVTADKVDTLINILKGVYLRIYSDDIYIVNLHNYVKETIIKTRGLDSFTSDGKYININKNKVLYPTLKDVINTSISIESLKDSSNLLS